MIINVYDMKEANNYIIIFNIIANKIFSSAIYVSKYKSIDSHKGCEITNQSM